ncbi:hypothetical protein RJ639_006231 [Escallonia herrerae]|uniref:Retrotransposon Copia-like N-terminal domain-containing protein n=1 Tax=Escallonia herrerae TaxID=1293975 RepID=A0AA88VWM2_9ASTE|nr:hypothetical protein RJ639_006231 [Escallonia herrerae]
MALNAILVVYLLTGLPLLTKLPLLSVKSSSASSITTTMESSSSTAPNCCTLSFSSFGDCLLHLKRTPLVTQLLNGDNYLMWGRAMIMALEAKTKLGFIDKTIKEPAADSTELSFWTRYNSMVTSWLIHSTIPAIANSILFTNIASESKMYFFVLTIPKPIVEEAAYEAIKQTAMKQK